MREALIKYFTSKGGGGGGQFERGAISSKYSICHILDEIRTNPLYDEKRGLKNLNKFYEEFNHTDLRQRLLKKDQLPDNVKSINIHKKTVNDTCVTKIKNGLLLLQFNQMMKRNICCSLRPSIEIFDWTNDCM